MQEGVIIIDSGLELKTKVQYFTANGNTTYDFPFDYLRKVFVKVKETYNNGVSLPSYTISGHTLTFDSPPPPQMYIDIYRETPTERLVSWGDGSVLKASDMTIQQVQELHILEETTDWAKDNAIITTDEGETWNARGRRITNVADPTDAQDAVTKKYMETVESGFIQQNIQIRDKVEQLEKSATTAASNASNSEQAALGYKNDCLFLLGEVEDTASQALTDIANAKTDATTTINNLKTTSISSITTYKNGAVSVIVSEKNNALLEMTNREQTALTNITNHGSDTLLGIDKAKNGAIDAVNKKQEVAVAAVKDQELKSVQVVKDAQKLTTTYLQGYVDNAAKSAKTAVDAANAARDDADAIREIAGGIQDTRIYPWKIEDGAMCIVVTERKEQLYV